MDTQNNSAPKPSWVKTNSPEPSEKPSWVKTITRADIEQSSVSPQDAAYKYVKKASTETDPSATIDTLKAVSEPRVVSRHERVKKYLNNRPQQTTPDSSVSPQDAAYAHLNKASSGDKKAAGIALSLIAGVVGIAISRTIIKPAMRQNAAPTSSESVPYSSSASTPGVVKTSMSEEEEADRARVVGFMAQVDCAARLYNHSKEEVDQKIAFFASTYGNSIYRLMTKPEIFKAANKISLLFNSNCTNVTDQKEMMRVMRPVFER